MGLELNSAGLSLDIPGIRHQPPELGIVCLSPSWVVLAVLQKYSLQFVYKNKQTNKNHLAISNNSKHKACTRLSGLMDKTSPLELRIVGSSPIWVMCEVLQVVYKNRKICFYKRPNSTNSKYNRSRGLMDKASDLELWV